MQEKGTQMVQIQGRSPLASIQAWKIDTSTCSNSRKLIKQNSTDTKMLFKVVIELKGNKDQIPLPQAKSDKDLAEEFAQFFLNKI